MNKEAEQVLAVFGGSITNWAEIKDRCGFSHHEVSLALRELRAYKLLTGDGLLNAPVKINSMPAFGEETDDD